MNIQAEVDFFSDLALVDRARFIMHLVAELAEEAKVGSGDGQELGRLKFVNDLTQRLSRFSCQLLSEDADRPKDDEVIGMLLDTRVDKDAERMVQNAYRRVLMSFDNFDTTVLLNPR